MSFGIIFALQVVLAVAAATSIIFVLRRNRRKARSNWQENLHVAVGAALAEQVALCLQTGLRISYHHRDYCGMGLCFLEDKYVYSPVHDGEFLPKPPGGGRLEFSSKEAFVSWLAYQTDQKFGAETDNQSMTIARLKAAIACRSSQGSAAI